MPKPHPVHAPPHPQRRQRQRLRPKDRAPVEERPILIRMESPLVLAITADTAVLNRKYPGRNITRQEVIRGVLRKYYKERLQGAAAATRVEGEGAVTTELRHNDDDTSTKE